MENILPYYEWLIVIATFITVIGIVISYKHMLAKLRAENFDEAAQKKLQSRFFINVFLVELLPLVLIVMSFMAVNTYQAQNPAVAMVITLLIAVFGIVMVVLERVKVDRNNEKEVKFLNVFTFMMLYLITAIPLVSVVLLLIAQKTV
jgi:undecaprenyl pyrophosphate phosphatase UppP